MDKLILQIIEVFAKNNLFNEKVELIGSWCFNLYVKHLGAKPFPLKTQDIDFLIPNPFKGKEHKELVDDLQELGFNIEFNQSGSIYLWNTELKIEFLTPQKGKGDDNTIKIEKLGIYAIPLRFVTLLLEKPIIIKENNNNILLPNPNNFCLHKLIIASRRKNIDKSLKDIQQAICTSIITDPTELKILFLSLPKKWKQSIFKMLDKSKKLFPLLHDETDSLIITLQ